MMATTLTKVEEGAVTVLEPVSAKPWFLKEWSYFVEQEKAKLAAFQYQFAIGPLDPRLTKRDFEFLDEQRTGMRPADKALWLIALRSGDYRQTRNYMQVSLPREDDSGERVRAWCAMGLLAHKLGRDAGAMSGREAGLAFRVPHFLCDHIMRWNDHAGMTFEQIADCVERWA